MRRLEDKPEISIIIPTYNHAHFLKRCLESVISQTFVNWEAIVVNNYSEDNTIELVNSFTDPRVHLVNFRNNGIIAAARNEGMRQSCGNLIAFLDSDDWWYPNKLEIAAKYLNNTDIVYHALDIFTNKGKRLIKRIRSVHLKKPVFIDLMKHSNVLANSSVVIRKSIIDKVGGLTEDKRFFATEDFDLWLKISRITDRFLYIPKSLGAYWIGENNITEVSEKQIKRLKAIYDKYLNLLSDRDRESAVIKMSYLFGRYKHKIGSLDEAFQYYKISVKSKILEERLKSLILMVMIYLHR